MMKSQHNYFVYGILILAIAEIIFLSGCIKQKPIEPSENATVHPNDSVIVKAPPDCEYEPCPSSPTPYEIIAPKINVTPEKILPSFKLLSWTKEGMVVDGVSSCTIIKDNEYWIYYTGKGIQIAKSSDGLNFIPMGTAVDVKDSKEKLDMVTNPSIFKTKDGKYRMLFEGSIMTDNKNDRKLYSAVSSDGLLWMVEEGVRFQDEGDGKPGELFTSVPDIIRLDDENLRMYYTRGITSAIAISDDEGISWVKEKNLELERIVIDPDIVRLDDGNYKLFFTSFDSEFGKGEQYVMSASSIDGTNFVLDEDKRIRPNPENDMVVDPDIIQLPDGRYRMYYGESSNGMLFKIYSAVSTD